MVVANLVRQAREVIITRATWGGSQNFLGAQWVAQVIERSPAQIQEQVALRLLSLSPHYFYDRDIRAEAERNRLSRKALAEALIAPKLMPAARVLDYGCGPGYMARAVADLADHVDAVDISQGVLACAKVLNGRSNISYLRPDELKGRAKVDLGYSFAVAQHLSTESMVGMLHQIAAHIRSGGVLLLHFAVPGQQGWRTETDVADTSLIGRVKMRYGLRCVGRTEEEMAMLVADSGFSEVAIRPLRGTLSVPGDEDVVSQHLLTARRL